MIDPKRLRDDLNRLKAAVDNKKFSVDWDAITRLDLERRQAVQAFEERRAEQKAKSAEVGKFKDKQSPEFTALLADMKAMAESVKQLEAKAGELEAQWQAAVMSIPNEPHPSVPVGHSEDDNQVHRTWGEPDTEGANALPHWDIPWFAKHVDFERGVKTTGAGFPFYVGDMARLVRALIHFFLESAHKSGYEEIMSPLVVNAASATATGQLPDKEGQMYHVTNEDFYLIPTAELPITNFLRDEILEEKALPVMRCGHTPCFRREAGSWGAHVRGLNRLHQFDKVELVKWVHPDTSFDELEQLLEHAESLLKALGLPFRTLLMCTGDIGFTHAKQYDIEVWAAGQKRWLEVSSCSNFTDFQARRAGIRFRPAVGGKAQLVHTLNGSGLAVPRVLAAILENHRQPDGTVAIPECLKPWYGGDTIGDPDT